MVAIAAGDVADTDAGATRLFINQRTSLTAVVSEGAAKLWPRCFLCIVAGPGPLRQVFEDIVLLLDSCTLAGRTHRKLAGRWSAAWAIANSRSIRRQPLRGRYGNSKWGRGDRHRAQAHDTRRPQCTRAVKF